ncbi:MAG TPA: hypothetical protein VJ725_00420 [Thermoanaerobaculia bacterium]|nr:hypothetical protein [Thermoanaerobaculia bacterium]
MTSLPFMRFPLDWNLEIEALHDHLRHGEFTRLSLLVRTSEPDWQYQALESLSSLLTQTSHLRSWYEASPGETGPSIALALHLARKAQDCRVEGPEEEAEAAGWAAEAREIVDRMAALEPDNVRIACARIEVARAQRDTDTIHEVWEAASRKHPDFFPLTVAYMTCLSPRFFGTHDEILAFARPRAADAEPGELRGLLPVFAYAELAASILAFLPEAESFRSVTDRYFRQDSVREEIFECARNYLGSDFEAWEERDVRALNVLLFTVELAGGRTLELSEALQERYTEFPWGWLGESRDSFERFALGLSGGDKWAEEVWLGDMNAIALIAISLLLLYFTLPEAVQSAKADRAVVAAGGFFGGPVLIHTPWVDVSVGLAFSALLFLFGAWLLMVKVTRRIARAW